MRSMTLSSGGSASLASPAEVYGEAINESLLASQKQMLNKAIGLPQTPEDSDQPKSAPFPVQFYIEIAPCSNRGSRCRLATCNKGPIQPGHYRIALSPSIEVGSLVKGRGGTAGMEIHSTLKQSLQLRSV
jgi:hypothetical protein